MILPAELAVRDHPSEVVLECPNLGRAEACQVRLDHRGSEGPQPRQQRAARPRHAQQHDAPVDTAALAPFSRETVAAQVAALLDRLAAS